MKPLKANAVIHHFAERLEWSAELSDEPSWVAFYKRLWPDLVTAVRIDQNSEWQKAGIDRLLILKNGRSFTVDEKKRAKDYGDILIEEWSVGRVVNGQYCGEKVGWSLDQAKRCDFIAYAIPTATKCYLLPFEILRQACVHNLERWKKLASGGRPAYPLDAQNEGYLTRNCSVPWGELKRAMCEQMLRRFAVDIQLPQHEPSHSPAGLEFTW